MKVKLILTAIVYSLFIGLCACGGGGSSDPQVTAVVKPTVGPQLRPCEAPEAPCPTK